MLVNVIDQGRNQLSKGFTNVSGSSELVGACLKQKLDSQMGRKNQLVDGPAS